MKFVDMELARRLELAGHPDWLEEDGDATPHPGRPENARIVVGGGIAEFRGVGSPVTQAEGLGLNGPVSNEEFERLEKFYRCRGSAVMIEVCPMADPSFVETLGKRGYRVVEFSNMLLREISDDEKFPPFAAGVAVREAAPSTAVQVSPERISATEKLGLGWVTFALSPAAKMRPRWLQPWHTTPGLGPSRATARPTPQPPEGQHSQKPRPAARLFLLCPVATVDQS